MKCFNVGPTGRILAIASGIAFAALGIWKLLAGAGDLAIYSVAGAAPIVLLLELPFCSMLSCIPFCKRAAAMPCTGKYVVKMLFHILVCAGGYAIFKFRDEDFAMLIPTIALTVAAAAYLIATLRREDLPALRFGRSSAGNDTAQVASARKAKQYGAKQQEQVTVFIADENGQPKTGQPPAITSYNAGANLSPQKAANQDKQNRAALFSGGGLFGGGNSARDDTDGPYVANLGDGPSFKGGYGGTGDGVPSANPFR